VLLSTHALASLKHTGALLFLVAAASAGQSLPSRAVATARLATGIIRIDGVLDEPDWQSAGEPLRLTQQSPGPGKPTPYGTEVRLLVSAHTLFVGVRCIDPDPSRIAVHTLIRDGTMEGDDSLQIVLDTFGDRRTGYFFMANAAGARADGLISGPQESSFDWDGIWQVATRVDREGWTAEFAIPAATLRFTPGAEAWGFNVSRQVGRERMKLFWSSPTLDSSIDDLSRAGLLTGVSALHQNLGLTVAPYVLGRFERDQASGASRFLGTAGGDVGYNLTPRTTGILTANPDFAETEVDTRQINLTRFPLFFPEKRAFFLEGSNLFGFGLGLDTSFIPFYSRRVGLRDERIVPIDVGVKVLGSAGRWGIAALDVETRDERFAPRTNLFAGRVTFDVDPHLRLGAIGTAGDPDGIHENSLGGVDAVWRTSTFQGDKNLFVGGWAARSFGDLPAGSPSGWGVKLSYPNDLWVLSANVNHFGAGLDPALGFLPRPGTTQWEAGGAYQPRPSTDGSFGWVRQFFFELEGRYVKNARGEDESWSVFMAPINVRMQSGDRFELNWYPQFERLDVPFEIADGVTIPNGRYRFDRFRAEAMTSETRDWQLGSTVWFGTFFGGRLTETDVFANLSAAGGHVRAELEAIDDFGDLPGGDFIQRLWLGKLYYGFSPNLLVASFVQYESDSREIGLNARLRWTIRPGNDVFVVWNRNWRQAISQRDAIFPTSDQVVVKLRMTFRR
jgi:Domain of unknown function (DUF5916)